MTPRTPSGHDDSRSAPPRPRLRSIADRDRAAEGGILGDPDLPSKVVDQIDGIADIFRSRIGEPIDRAATAIVLALLALIAGSAAATMMLIGLFRLTSELFSPYQWIAHAAFGVMFVVLGVLVFWRRAFRQP